MNANDKFIHAFHQCVEGNYEVLKSDKLYAMPPKELLKQILQRVSDKIEKPYPIGTIAFNTPQEALRICNSNDPMYYMDKLVILAAFALCLKYEFQVVSREVSFNKIVTYLKVFDPLGLVIVPYYLCPGKPFNVHP